MAPKRKSDVVDLTDSDVETAKPTLPKKAKKDTPSTTKTTGNASTSSKTGGPSKTAVPAPKITSAAAKKAAAIAEELDAFERDVQNDRVEIYDDCNEIRRKIRALQKEPGFKITHWLREIGDINSNSYGRFMKLSGPTSGAENGVYPAAYIYFERRRIKEGKKKTAKRLDNEHTHYNGMPLEDRRRRGVWVFAA
ncbi:hypothetical protein DL93DRAFT_2142728 [Clavulina sp. PMI_390]|nr:hypothetical protein DL93DRAFT_2142728 [Clavulina sp. PMI_390]